MVDRVFLLSHPTFHQKNLEYCINILLENGYLLPFLFKKMNDRLKTLISNNRTTSSKKINNTAIREKNSL